MKRILFLLILSICVVNMSAQSYTVERDADNKCVIAGFTSVAGADDILFAKAMLWVLSNTDQQGFESMSDFDYTKLYFDIPLVMQVGENESYLADLNVKVADGRVIYTISNIVWQTTVIVARKLTPFERLQPEKKPTHKAAVREFERQATKVLDGMFDNIKGNSLSRISHWENIRKNEAVKGMGIQEAMLAVGHPRMERTNGNEVQWQTVDGVFIFFNNGVATSVVK